MHPCSIFLLVSVLPAVACSSPGAAPRDPGSPTPVAGPAPEEARPARPPGSKGSESAAPLVPVRPDQAPLVPLRDALEADSLLGRRVRVAGRCTAPDEGNRAGFWILTAADAAIEVRGRVPSSCFARGKNHLTIFAQVEPKSAGSRDRLLLRLPD